MSKENQSKKYDGQNRCRRCDRPLSDPNDIYGWRCAQIVGFGKEATARLLDDVELLLYNDYINLHSVYDKREPRGSFTTRGRNYKNSFVKEEKPDTKKVIYHVLTDVTVFGGTFQVEYEIDNGVVRFPFEDNKDYLSIVWHGGSRRLAKAIYDAAKELSPDNFSGRTIDGINAELQLHWAAYKSGIKKENAKVADVGGMMQDRPGFDSNAWAFEALEFTGDIIDPKADDIIELVQEIWGHLIK